MKDFKYIYFLTKVDGLGSVRVKRLLEKFNSAENVFDASVEELSEVENISSKTAESVLKSSKDFKILERNILLYGKS